MSEIIRNPPQSEILPKRYWKVKNTGKPHKENPIGFIRCVYCGWYFPVYRHGRLPEKCYRCTVNTKNARYRAKFIKLTNLSEDNFCIVVLTRAKEIFGEDAAKIDLDRMVKLCCFVAEDVGYPLTRGWYKEVQEGCER